MEKLISVIVPVYNHARTLRDCLFSVYRQTYRPLQIIVVNDGSTDNFSEVVDAIVSDLNIDIKIINQENLGAPAARNRGFTESKGDYVIFVDADTIMRSDMLQKMSEALQNSPRASYAYSRFKFGWKTIKSRPFDASVLRRVNYIDVSSLIRREDFISFDESLKRFQDWDLWLSLLSKNKTGVFVPEILYKKSVQANGRGGMSCWLPSFVYKLPWKIKAVQDYEKAREVVLDKHR